MKGDKKSLKVLQDFLRILNTEISTLSDYNCEASWGPVAEEGAASDLLVE